MLQIGSVSFDREGVANHATQLANNIQGNLKRSLESLGVVSKAERGEPPIRLGFTSFCVGVALCFLVHKMEAGSSTLLPALLALAQQMH